MTEQTSACTVCGTLTGNPHAEKCAAADAIRRRSHESYSIVVDSHTVVLWAELQNGWKPSWSGFGKSSADGPLGGIEERRFRTADEALCTALADVLPIMRVMRGRAT